MQPRRGTYTSGSGRCILKLTPEQDALERAAFRELIFEAFGYKIYDPAVKKFHESNAKMKIVSCPARTSKSYAGWKDVLPDVFLHLARANNENDLETLLIWIVAPNYDMAKEFDYAWEDLIERREALGFDYEIRRAAKAVGQGNMVIQIHCGKNIRGQDVDVIIEVKTAANEKTLQSEEVGIAILSEAARLPSIVWTKYLSTRVGRSILPTTPDLKAKWIHDEIERGKKNPRLKIENFQFTPLANPKYQYERYWVEHQKAESRVDPVRLLTCPVDDLKPPSKKNGHDCFDEAIDCYAMKDDAFAEQFGGHWTFHRGRVVPFRTKASAKGEISHVIDYDKEWFQWCDVNLSFDYGYTDAVVVGFWMVGPSQVVLRKSIYESELTPDDVIDRVHLMIQENKWEGRVTRMIGDPKKPEVVEAFRRRGLPIWDVDKRAQADRKAGHLEFMNFLSTNPRTGEPYFMIHEDNVEIIEEWSSLTYNENVRDPYTTNAFLGADHGYDMARYFFQSHPAIKFHNKAVKLEDTDFAQLRRSITKRGRRRRQATVGQPSSSGLASVGL
jgi:hypothetical protein